MDFSTKRQKDLYFIQRLSHRLDSSVWQTPLILNCRCPICGDSKYNKKKRRFFFLPGTNFNDNYSFYCHNCGVGGSLFHFLSTYHPDLHSEYIFKEFLQKKQNTEIVLPSVPSMKEILKVDDSVFHSIGNLIPVELLSSTDPFRLYLYNRNLDVTGTEKGRFFVATDIKAILDANGVNTNNMDYIPPCLVIPFFKQDRTFDIFQVRFIDMVSPGWKGPKYLTFKKTPGAEKIYWLDFIDKSKTVYTTEGPIDSMFIQNSIAVGGSDMNKYLEYLDDVVYVLDNQPKNKEIVNKIEKLISLNKKVVIWPSYVSGLKDINDIIIQGTTRQELSRLLSERTFCGLDALVEFISWKKC